MTVICTDYSAKAAICLVKKLIIVYYAEYGVPGLDQSSKFSINTQFVTQVPEKKTAAKASYAQRYRHMRSKQAQAGMHDGSQA